MAILFINDDDDSDCVASCNYTVYTLIEYSCIQFPLDLKTYLFDSFVAWSVAKLENQQSASFQR